MKYKTLVDYFEKIYSTTKRIEKTFYISKLLKITPMKDIDSVTLLLQGEVYPIWDNRKLGVASQLLIKAFHIATGFSIKEINKSWKETGDLGITTENLISKKRQVTLFSESLSLNKVMKNLRSITEQKGSGSVDVKIKLIAELFSLCEPVEAKYISRILLGAMRIGLGEGTLRDAIVWSFLPKIQGIFVFCKSCGKLTPSGVDSCLNCSAPLEEEEIPKNLKILKVFDLDDLKDLSNLDFLMTSEKISSREIYNFVSSKVQDAYNLTNDFGLISKVLKKKSLIGLENIKLEVGHPIKVMLALKSKNVKNAFEMVGRPAMLEYKYDGFRMQVHKDNENVKIFTRKLEDVTEQFPDVVRSIKKFVKTENCIIEGEAIGYDPKTKAVRPFQNISQRIKRKYDIQRLIKTLPIEFNVFDIVLLKHQNLIKHPFKERRKLLKTIINEEKYKIKLSDGIITDDDNEAEIFFEDALKRGHEGLMFKKLDAIYKPGGRVGYMVKLKPVTETFDLVIVGAEWGEGKRSKWLSSFIVACRDGDDFLTIGKVSTGFKEKSELGMSFSDMTKLLEPLILSSSSKHVTVRPEIIIEIGFQEIQKSPTYESGFALRFPVFLRLREDKALDEITSIEDVKNAYSGL